MDEKLKYYGLDRIWITVVVIAIIGCFYFGSALFNLQNEFKKYKETKDEQAEKENQSKIGRFFIDETRDENEFQITIMSMTGDSRYFTVVNKKDLLDILDRSRKILDMKCEYVKKKK